ncbi:hypothetical protein Zmor_005288 [Zophobas morio]|uniref:Uncharacterized protein n=1 Tax=Zophobas morio TaxID=2755281 RepID=A0AA38IU86_9CUCU|nr:hypothetical protein Zmor_005288 [Zophobas morio]
MGAGGEGIEARTHLQPNLQPDCSGKRRLGMARNSKQKLLSWRALILRSLHSWFIHFVLMGEVMTMKKYKEVAAAASVVGNKAVFGVSRRKMTVCAFRRSVRIPQK